MSRPLRLSFTLPTARNAYWSISAASADTPTAPASPAVVRPWTPVWPTPTTPHVPSPMTPLSPLPKTPTVDKPTVNSPNPVTPTPSTPSVEPNTPVIGNGSSGVAPESLLKPWTPVPAPVETPANARVGAWAV